MSDPVAELARASWFHSFEVLPGVWSPGRTGRIDPSHVLSDLHGLPADMSGLKALDIGALDGPYTFELERRGAEVTAVDIQDPDRTGFNTAKRVIGSKATYIQGNVYDLRTLFQPETFDLVLFFGVWYHLKNPVAAFEQINQVMKVGGQLAGEGETLLNYAEFGEAKPDALDLAKSEIPLSIFYPRGCKGDRFTWYVPNPACVAAWLDSASFALEQKNFEDATPHQRMRITARKVVEEVPIDNPVW